MAKITKSSSSNNTTNKSEVQVQKSPAEFFAEHQAIAGFDNYGKSLYTSIRELVENGLDACEAINVLPDISIDIKEYTQNQFNQISVNDLRLTTTSQQQQQTPKRPTKTVLDHQWSPDKPIHHQQEQIDTELFQKKKRKNKSKTQQETKEKKEEEEEEELEETENGDSKKAQAASNTASKNKNNNTNTSNHQYFLITVRDNGCGMSHKAIPDLFGRVLSGSKYGVRQTRGKFGLGAKMALIWSKKSTGHPIHIQTAHRNQRDQVPDKVSSCILDIDIYKNQPRILDHTQCQNKSGFVGTTVRVLIAGNWTTYKSRIVQYLQQLAIITPYAALEMTYSEKSGKRNLELKYERRSEQMPDTPVTVKHHPASVNNIIIQQLVQFTKTKNMLQFLSKELSAVSPALAKRLIAELASSTGLTEDANPKDLTDKQITRLVQLFHQVQLFRPPDGSCLSPLGEYNLNLGIHKVLEPEFIATARDKPSAYEGHPFVIEAAVSLGGKHLKEGITVFRFANRIPLLFEGGADVATRVALTKIRWSSYKMDHKRDKIGVYVSIVSTKMPFKGTSKEYIGDDATEIHQSVKRALQNCCQQLRTHLTKRNALKDAKTRKSRLAKYVPDVSRSLFGLLDGMRKRRADAQNHSASEGIIHSPTKRLRVNENEANIMIKRLDRGEITEDSFHRALTETIEAENPDIDSAAAKNSDLAAREEAAIPVYIVPLYNLDDASSDFHHPLFTFRSILPIRRLMSEDASLAC